jgi:hypothetical protein
MVSIGVSSLADFGGPLRAERRSSLPRGRLDRISECHELLQLTLQFRRRLGPTNSRLNGPSACRRFKMLVHQ